MTLATSVQADGLRDIDAFAASHGLDLSLRLGFEGFASFPIDRGGHPVFAGFAPPRDGFWIAVTLHGRPFATLAAMPMDMVGSLTEHLVVDGLYPGPDRWEPASPIARAVCDSITGKCLFGGGVVVDVKGRGTKESAMIAEQFGIATRIIANALYGIEHFAYFTKSGRALASRFGGEVVCHDAVRWTRDGVDLGLRALGYSSWAYSLRRLSALRATWQPL